MKILMDYTYPKVNKVVSIISGGMDSSILTIMLAKHYGAENVYPVSFNYNQKQIYELSCAKTLTKILGTAKHKELDLSVLGDIAKPVSSNINNTNIDMPDIKEVLGDPQPVTYVPFRNMIMLSLAVAYAETQNINHVFTGLQVHDEYGYWDTTQEFVDGLNNVTQQNRMNKIKVEAPFINLSKIHELEICKELNQIDLLKYTLTCYNPDHNGRSCGKCPSCSERINAFMQMNIIDPIDYQIDIPWSDKCVQYPDHSTIQNSPN